MYPKYGSLQPEEKKMEQIHSPEQTALNYGIEEMSYHSLFPKIPGFK
jgi:hypothetical protein